MLSESRSCPILPSVMTDGILESVELPDSWREGSSQYDWLKLFAEKQWATMSRTWWMYDARYQCPFRSADLLIKYLQGKHKPVYHRYSDVGDHVVVINTKHVAMREDFWRTFSYSHHTGYSKGFSRTSAWRLHNIEPTQVMEKAVYSRLPGDLLRRTLMSRLHLYPEEDVPEDILANISDQIRQIQIVPKRYDQYTKEEIESFPTLFDWPDEYVIKDKKEPAPPVEDVKR